MRPATLIACVCATLGLSAQGSFANQLDFSWNACPEDGGTSDVTMPCADPDGMVKLFISFVLSDTIKGSLAIDFGINLLTDGNIFPEFWEFETPFGSGCHSGLDLSCADPSCTSGEAALENCVTGVLSVGGFTTPLGGRIVGSVYRAPPPTPGADLVPGRRYVVGVLTFRTQGAVEAGGACAGCPTPIAFGMTFDSGRVPPSTSILISSIVPGGAREHFIGYSGPCFSANGGAYLCEATPVLERSWGTVKTIYR